MIWIAPTEKDTATASLEKRLWDAADQCHANSGPKSQEYSAPVRGIISMCFAAHRTKLEKASASIRRGLLHDPCCYHAEGFQDLLSEARFDSQLNRPEAENIGTESNLWLTPADHGT